MHAALTQQTCKSGSATGSFKLLLLLLLMSRITFVSAQSCGSCTVTLSGYDTLAYTVTSGQIFCIDSTGQFEGTLTLSGGTVCNKGIFHPKSLSVITGTINNYSCLRLDADLSLGPGLHLINGSRSTADFLGSLSISGGELNNGGIASIDEDIIFSSGVFVNSAIINCKTLSGAGIATVSNSGIISKD